MERLLNNVYSALAGLSPSAISPPTCASPPMQCVAPSPSHAGALPCPSVSALLGHPPQTPLPHSVPQVPALSAHGGLHGTGPGQLPSSS
eukprot:4628615-Amphidinium_carterae.1